MVFTSAGRSNGNVTRRRFPGCTSPMPICVLIMAGVKVCDQLPPDSCMVAFCNNAWTGVSFSTVIVGCRLPCLSVTTPVAMSLSAGLPCGGATLTTTPKLTTTWTELWVGASFTGNLRYREKVTLAFVEHRLTRPLHSKNLSSPGRDNRLRREHEQIFAAVGKFTLAILVEVHHLEVGLQRQRVAPVLVMVTWLRLPLPTDVSSTCNGVTEVAKAGIETA